MIAAVAQFAILLGFWLLLSMRFDPVFLGMGVLSAAAVTAFTRRLAASALRGSAVPWARAPWAVWRFAVYIVWLLGRMVLASVQMAYVVLHPRMPLDPVVVRIPTALRSRAARVIVANSITLIPGTLTIDLREREFLVHAFVPEATEDLVSGRLQNIVGSIFLEDPEPPITPTMEPYRRLGP